ncbi:hypothetical protein EIN_182940 [Entamoeba invadens IP1]|uniref:hypothetical protein n=1 Tax=Entamoeba invadens IP1 TaxID=370355 RepID=UPI0002C3F32D|nr:hypothetical protein EIN_182940 [Entamoeba invadens IP1]ELP94037.1 hypothetical protein EIN_182940 [Entamoeba invadens IP1]|eukprot:XP_004260808.1 hypothetical protein EIN_182940 [Entamoeba invadens IP1]
MSWEWRRHNTSRNNYDSVNALPPDRDYSSEFDIFDSQPTPVEAHPCHEVKEIKDVKHASDLKCFNHGVQHVSQQRESQIVLHQETQLDIINDFQEKEDIQPLITSTENREELSRDQSNSSVNVHEENEIADSILRLPLTPSTHIQTPNTFNEEFKPKRRIPPEELQNFDKPENCSFPEIASQDPFKEDTFDPQDSFLFIGPTKHSYISTVYQKITKLLKKKNVKAVFFMDVVEVKEGEKFPPSPCPVYILSLPFYKEQLEKVIVGETTILSGIGSFYIDKYSFVYSTIDETVDAVQYKTTKQLIKNFYPKENCTFMLTSYWPSYVLDRLSLSSKPTFKVTYSDVAAILAKGTNPNYHFTSGKMFYQRPPFRTEIENKTVISEFYSLAPETEYKKCKSVFLVQPKKQQKWENNINPYDRVKFSKAVFNELESERQRLVGQKERRKEAAKDVQKSSVERHTPPPKETKPIKQRTLTPQERLWTCWFCMSSTSSFDDKLLISCGLYFYITYAKGPLIERCLNVVPIHHIGRLSEMVKEGIEELQKYLTALKMFYNSFSSEVVGIECVSQRNESGFPTHTFLQVFPLEKNSENFFIDFLRTKMGSLREVKNVEIGPLEGYTFVTTPSGRCFFGKRVNVRSMMSEWYRVKVVNWKVCQEEYSCEERKAREIRHDFMRFDTVLLGLRD